MIEKGHGVAPRGNSWMRDVTGRLVEHLSDRELESASSLRFPNDREGTVGTPVGPPHVLQDLPRSRSARDADPGESSRPHEGLEDAGVQREGHLSRAGDRQDLGTGDAEGTRFGRFGATHEDLDRFAVPRRCVEDRLAVRCEARRYDLAPPEGQLVKRGGRRSPRAPAGEKSGDEPGEENQSGERDQEPPSPAGGCLRYRLPHAADLRDVIPHAGEVAREITRRGVALL